MKKISWLFPILLALSLSGCPFPPGGGHGGGMHESGGQGGQGGPGGQPSQGHQQGGHDDHQEDGHPG